MNKEQHAKYYKPEGCAYPYQFDPLDYCWTYANMVDKGKEHEMDCDGCEYKLLKLKCNMCSEVFEQKTKGNSIFTTCYKCRTELVR